MNQISMFDGSQRFKLNKPIRLISLFSGYDSQALALKYLGVKFEHWKTCEWAVKSIQALKDLHFSNDSNDYSAGHSDEFILNRLAKWGISANYNEPMTKEQIKRLGIERQRKIYNNIKATHNLVNIQQVSGSDLEIKDTEKYTYIMTYSFPCQDLSKAGLGKGMAKGLGTRSGMLWEVERILDDCVSGGELPQVLLMENVPDVIGTKNIKHFAEWLKKLETLGYKCFWQVLNAKDYGIPQNRERCFMISILGDYYYNFPAKVMLEKKLKDLLEDDVDEKYFLSAKMVSFLEKHNEQMKEKKLLGYLYKPKYGKDIANCLRTNGAFSPTDNGLVMKQAGGENGSAQKIVLPDGTFDVVKINENYIEYRRKGFFESETRIWNTNNYSPTLTTHCEKLMFFEEEDGELKTKIM